MGPAVNLFIRSERAASHDDSSIGPRASESAFVKIARKDMITGPLKSRIDAIWDVFWSGGISNPMDVIEQMTYLLFLKRLDELQLAEERKANRLRITSPSTNFG